jgi:hypothetical protein
MRVNFEAKGGDCMKTIRDYPHYYQRMIGYMRIHMLCDEDFFLLKEQFEEKDLEKLGLKEDSECLNRLYFLVDVSIMEYYFYYGKDIKKSKGAEKKNSIQKASFSEQVKMKYIAIFLKIIDQYHTFYEELIHQSYKENYQVLHLDETDDYLYDIMTLNQEILLYDLLTINTVKGHLHEKLSFCYKHYVEGFSTVRILEDLRKQNLSKLFIDFVNEYAFQSGLPQVVVMCYFYPLEEDLYQKNLADSKIKDYFTPIDFELFLKLERNERVVFVKNLIEKRVNVIDKWCSRVRGRMIEDTINLLSKSQVSLEVHAR